MLLPAISHLRAVAAALSGLVTLGAVTAAVAVAAQPRCPRTTLAAVESEVMCVACGTPLGLANAPQAERERAFIQQLIASCHSKAAIKAQLVKQYGDSVLATPARHGFAQLAYLVPLIALPAALIGVTLTLLRWRRRSVSASERAARSDRGYSEPLVEELTASE